jgi:hypothetical protein
VVRHPLRAPRRQCKLDGLLAGVPYYPGLRGIYFANPTKGAISVAGPGGVCSILTGWFAIAHITFSQYSVSALDLRFVETRRFQPALLDGVPIAGVFRSDGFSPRR